MVSKNLFGGFRIFIISNHYILTAYLYFAKSVIRIFFIDAGFHNIKVLDNDGNITYTNQSGDKYQRNYSLLKHLKGEQAITEEEADLFKKKFDNGESMII